MKRDPRLQPIPGLRTPVKVMSLAASLDVDREDRIRARAENLMSRGVSELTAWDWAKAEIEQEMNP